MTWFKGRKERLNESERDQSELKQTTKDLQAIAGNLKATVADLEMYVLQLKIKAIAEEQITTHMEKLDGTDH